MVTRAVKQLIFLILLTNVIGIILIAHWLVN